MTRQLLQETKLALINLLENVLGIKYSTRKMYQSFQVIKLPIRCCCTKLASGHSVLIVMGRVGREKLQKIVETYLKVLQRNSCPHCDFFFGNSQETPKSSGYLLLILDTANVEPSEVTCLIRNFNSNNCTLKSGPRTTTISHSHSTSAICY